MNRKISLGIAISIAAIACAVTFVITMTVSLTNYNDKIADVQQRGEVYTKLQEADSFVRSYSLYDVDDEKMKNGVYSGYLKGLNDSRARYYTTDEYYYKTQTESGRLVGLGMEYEREESGYIRVRNVYKGSPADAGGILTGDVIISVGGVSVLESGYDTAVSKLLYGDEGTKQKFALRRNGEETGHELSRVLFDIPSVSGMLLDNGIMYLKFYSINEATADKLAEELDHGSDAQITGYIFDLRGCSSGVYTSVSGILESFLPARNIAAAVYRNGSVRIIVQTQDDGCTALPIGVLTDEKTGGSAELIAQALKLHAGAQTFGETSMGYATLQETKVFSDGTAAEISVAAIKAYDGTEDINDSADYGDKGVIPEFITEYDGEYEPDPFAYSQTRDIQLKKAVELIMSKAAPAESIN